MEKGNESIEDEELFDEDLEEVLEDEENLSKDSQDYSEEEDLDEEPDEETDKEIISKEQTYRNLRLNQILANPWKSVSLDETGFKPKVSLERNFEEENFKEDKKNETLDYMKPFNEENKREYQSAKIQGKFEDSSMSKEERNLEEQKRLYSSPMNLMQGMEDSKNQKKDMVNTEDIIKRDYFSKKKIF